MAEPFITEDSDHPACGICPSLRLPREAFVVYDRPSRECPFNPADGHRYTAEGTPACVHPDKIGQEPDRIAPPYVPETEPQPQPRGRRDWFRRR
ncbi:hypothetical protein [Streptomyces sp. NPDC096033]|uniref:hypothetical protein n=1 Tax=Streptomyces sp. NPDC096033 TaxID=3366071 RepID=UPI0037FB1137